MRLPKSSERCWMAPERAATDEGDYKGDMQLRDGAAASGKQCKARLLPEWRPPAQARCRGPRSGRRLTCTGAFTSVIAAAFTMLASCALQPSARPAAATSRAPDKLQPLRARLQVRGWPAPARQPYSVMAAVWRAGGAQGGASGGKLGQSAVLHRLCLRALLPHCRGSWRLLCASTATHRAGARIARPSPTPAAPGGLGVGGAAAAGPAVVCERRGAAQLLGGAAGVFGAQAAGRRGAGPRLPRVLQVPALRRHRHRAVPPVRRQRRQRHREGGGAVPGGLGPPRGPPRSLRLAAARGPRLPAVPLGRQVHAHWRLHPPSCPPAPLASARTSGTSWCRTTAGSTPSGSSRRVSRLGACWAAACPLHTAVRWSPLVL